MQTTQSVFLIETHLFICRVYFVPKITSYCVMYRKILLFLKMYSLFCSVRYQLLILLSVIFSHILLFLPHLMLFQPIEPTVVQKQTEDHFSGYLDSQWICDNRFLCYLHRGLCSRISGISGLTRELHVVLDSRLVRTDNALVWKQVYFQKREFHAENR